MEKLSILMSREAHRAWSEAHPLGSEIEVTVAGTVLAAAVSEFSDYHGKVEVRMKIKEKR